MSFNCFQSQKNAAGAKVGKPKKPKEDEKRCHSEPPTSLYKEYHERVHQLIFQKPTLLQKEQDLIDTSAEGGDVLSSLRMMPVRPPIVKPFPVSHVPTEQLSSNQIEEQEMPTLEKETNISPVESPVESSEIPVLSPADSTGKEADSPKKETPTDTSVQKENNIICGISFVDGKIKYETVSSVSQETEKMTIALRKRKIQGNISPIEVKKKKQVKGKKPADANLSQSETYNNKKVDKSFNSTVKEITSEENQTKNLRKKGKKTSALDNSKNLDDSSIVESNESTKENVGTAKSSTKTASPKKKGRKVNSSDIRDNNETNYESPSEQNEPEPGKLEINQPLAKTPAPKKKGKKTVKLDIRNNENIDDKNESKSGKTKVNQSLTIIPSPKKKGKKGKKNETRAIIPENLETSLSLLQVKPEEPVENQASVDSTIPKTKGRKASKIVNSKTDFIVTQSNENLNESTNELNSPIERTVERNQSPMTIPISKKTIRKANKPESELSQNITESNENREEFSAEIDVPEVMVAIQSFAKTTKKRGGRKVNKSLNDNHDSSRTQCNDEIISNSPVEVKSEIQDEDNVLLTTQKQKKRGRKSNIPVLDESDNNLVNTVVESNVSEPEIMKRKKKGKKTSKADSDNDFETSEAYVATLSLSASPKIIITKQKAYKSSKDTKEPIVGQSHVKELKDAPERNDDLHIQPGVDRQNNDPPLPPGDSEGEKPSISTTMHSPKLLRSRKVNDISRDNCISNNSPYNVSNSKENIDSEKHITSKKRSKKSKQTFETEDTDILKVLNSSSSLDPVVEDDNGIVNMYWSDHELSAGIKIESQSSSVEQSSCFDKTSSNEESITNNLQLTDVPSVKKNPSSKQKGRKGKKLSGSPTEASKASSDSTETHSLSTDVTQNEEVQTTFDGNSSPDGTDVPSEENTEPENVLKSASKSPAQRGKRLTRLSLKKTYEMSSSMEPDHTDLPPELGQPQSSNLNVTLPKVECIPVEKNSSPLGSASVPDDLIPLNITGPCKQIGKEGSHSALESAEVLLADETSLIRSDLICKSPLSHKDDKPDEIEEEGSNLNSRIDETAPLPDTSVPLDLDSNSPPIASVQRKSKRNIKPLLEGIASDLNSQQASEPETFKATSPYRRGKKKNKDIEERSSSDPASCNNIPSIDDKTDSNEHSVLADEKEIVDEGLLTENILISHNDISSNDCASGEPSGMVSLDLKEPAFSKSELQSQEVTETAIPEPTPKRPNSPENGSADSPVAKIENEVSSDNIENNKILKETITIEDKIVSRRRPGRPRGTLSRRFQSSETRRSNRRPVQNDMSSAKYDEILPFEEEEVEKVVRKFYMPRRKPRAQKESIESNTIVVQVEVHPEPVLKRKISESYLDGELDVDSCKKIKEDNMSGINDLEDKPVNSVEESSIGQLENTDTYNKSSSVENPLLHEANISPGETESASIILSKSVDPESTVDMEAQSLEQKSSDVVNESHIRENYETSSNELQSNSLTNNDMSTSPQATDSASITPKSFYLSKSKYFSSRASGVTEVKVSSSSPFKLNHIGNIAKISSDSSAVSPSNGPKGAEVKQGSDSSNSSPSRFKTLSIEKLRKHDDNKTQIESSKLVVFDFVDNDVEDCPRFNDNSAINSNNLVCNQPSNKISSIIEDDVSESEEVLTIELGIPNKTVNIKNDVISTSGAPCTTSTQIPGEPSKNQETIVSLADTEEMLPSKKKKIANNVKTNGFVNVDNVSVEMVETKTDSISGGSFKIEQTEQKEEEVNINSKTNSKKDDDIDINRVNKVTTDITEAKKLKKIVKKKKGLKKIVKMKKSLVKRQRSKEVVSVAGFTWEVSELESPLTVDSSEPVQELPDSSVGDVLPREVGRMSPVLGDLSPPPLIAVEPLPLMPLDGPASPPHISPARTSDKTSIRSSTPLRSWETSWEPQTHEPGLGTIIDSVNKVIAA